MTQPLRDEIVVATAADQGYVVPLAATVRSLIDALDEQTRIRVFVLDGGLAGESRAHLEESWRHSHVRIEWLQPDMDRLSHFPVSHHVTLTSYARLLLPDLLPGDVTKVIYLDADMIVRRDLQELFDEPLGDALALAVQETAAPWIDAQIATPDYENRAPYIAAATPIANYRELGIDPELPYFNAGFFVFDARQWREEQISRQVLACLEDHREHVLWWDQYALNVVLAGRWRAVDPRWNQSAGIFGYPTWAESPFSSETYERLLADPWIVHYCSPTKPWHFYCEHPFQQDFYQALQGTYWSDWKPPAPNPFTRKGWRQYRKVFKRRVRNMVLAMRQSVSPAAGVADHPSYRRAA